MQNSLRFCSCMQQTRSFNFLHELCVSMVSNEKSYNAHKEVGRYIFIYTKVVTNNFDYFTVTTVRRNVYPWNKGRLSFRKIKIVAAKSIQCVNCASIAFADLVSNYRSCKNGNMSKYSQG